MENKVVMITGGRGFIGSNLANYLKYKNKVEVYDKSDGNDIRDFSKLNKEMKGMDYVFHFAALASVTEGVKNPKEVMDHNILGTYNVIKAAAINKVKRVVFASSSAVYGEPEYTPIDENHKLKAVSAYPISKIFCENLLQKFKQEYNLNSIALRYFNVYGPNQNLKYGPVIPSFIKSALKDEDIIIFGDGKQTRDFIYINDVNRANVLAAKNNNYGFFNIASGKSIEIEELAKLIIELTESKSKIVFSKSRPGDVIHSFANVERARSILNFIPKYTLEEGLKETIEWYRLKLD